MTQKTKDTIAGFECYLTKKMNLAQTRRAQSDLQDCLQEFNRIRRSIGVRHWINPSGEILTRNTLWDRIIRRIDQS
jgi:hypothetical protein